MSGREPVAGPPGYLSRLGLHKEPFAGHEEEFYYHEATRDQRLTLLLNLAPYCEVLLVTGGRGSGKTTLLRQFLSQAMQGWLICRFQAAPAPADKDALMCALASEFAPEITSQGRRDERISGLREQLRILRRSAQTPLLVVDDAHELPDDDFALLAELVDPAQGPRDKLLGIILFATPPIEKRLGTAAARPLRAHINHTFSLPPFSEEDTANYVIHCLAVAGAPSPGPFTGAVLKVIYRNSQGIPARINALAQLVLRTSTLPSPEAPATPGSPTHGGRRPSRYFLVGLLAVVLAVVLAYQDRINRLFQPGREGQSAIPASGEHILPGTMLVSPLTDQFPVKPPVSDVAKGGHRSQPVTETATEEPSFSTQRREMVMGEAVISARQEVEPFSHGKVNPENARPSAAPANTTAGRPEQGAEQLITVQDEKTGRTALKDAAWLLAQDPAHFTLQLFAAREEATVIRFIEDHGLRDKTAYYRTLRQGNVLFAIVYGVYPSRSAALSARKNLPAGLAGIVPWARSLRAIQASIMDFRERHG